VTRARAALLATAAFLLSVGLSAGPATRAEAATVPRHGVVILFVIDGVSFEELLSVPEFASLARAGGAGLMATSDRYRNDPAKVDEALGSGAQPDGHVRGLLGRTLAGYGVTVCGRGLGTPASPKLFESEVLSLLGGRACTGTGGDLFQVEWILTASEADAARLTGKGRQEVVAELGDTVAGQIREFAGGRTMVIVVSPMASPDMIRRGDEVNPIVVASGRSDRLLRRSGPMRALRSDTTRQSGLVANVDVASTILNFFGIPIPSEMDGQAIEFTHDSAPFDLHRRHLEQRSIRLPIQLAEVAFVSASGAVAIVLLLVASRRRFLPRRLGDSMTFVTLCVAALPIPLILGGVLPRLTYWVVVPFVVPSVVGLAILAWSVRWPGPLGPLIFLAAVGLSVVVVDALWGWRGARIPLLGGTMFDGARFYGLPNAFLCLLLAGGLFVAAALPAFTGFLVLVGAGLFAGFPSLGADVGGTITLFFAAGLWWVLRTRPHLGLREVAFVAGVTAMGLGVILLANRYLPGIPTHATRFVEGTGGGLGDALREFEARSGIGFDQVRNAPAALIPLIGLPVVLALVLTRPGPIGWGFEMTGKRWQHALVVLTLAGMVAFFVNDTGVAAAAPVFLFAMSGMAYPAFVAAIRGDTNRHAEAEVDGEGR
jgi:hypothetical protein